MLKRLFGSKQDASHPRALAPVEGSDQEGSASDSVPSPAPSTPCTPTHQSLDSGAIAELVSEVLGDAHKVATELPSCELSLALRPCRSDPFTAEIGSAQLWMRTMGLLKQAGSWGHERKAEVQQRIGHPLHALRKPLAKRAFGVRGVVNFPVGRSGTGDDFRVDNLSTTVSGSYHVTRALRWPPGGGPRQDGAFVGTCAIKGGDEAARSELLSTCLTEIWAPGGERRGEPPAFVIGRHGRVDSPLKLRRLALLAAHAASRLGHAGPSAEAAMERAATAAQCDAVSDAACSTPRGSAESGRTRRRSRGARLRFRFCSLLNALVADRRELGFFRGQLLQLTRTVDRRASNATVRTPPGAHVEGQPAGAPTQPSAAAAATLRKGYSSQTARPLAGSDGVSAAAAVTPATTALPADAANFSAMGSEFAAAWGDATGTEACDESIASLGFEFLSVSQGQNDDFDLAAGMEQLGAEYSYLNFSANWPLSLRLGTGPPHGGHNISHPAALRRHLQWLAHDIADALGALPGGLADSSKVAAQVRALAPVWEAPDTGGGEVLQQGLSRLRAALAALRRAAERAGPGSRETARRLAMATELLTRLAANRGSNFRRRAAELLQLCVLEHILGVIPFFNCKSGIDRAGVCAALWTTFCQLVSGSQPQLWLWYYLALAYPVLIKTVHRLHGCGEADSTGERCVPLQQLREGCYITGEDVLLPFPPEPESEAARYADVVSLARIVSGGDHQGAPERRAHLLLERLFFADADALLPQLQTGFLANQLGVTVKIAAASTGAHGLKYGDSGAGTVNALAAQFYPRVLLCPEDPQLRVPLCELRKGMVATDVALAQEMVPYIVGASSARGT